MTSYFLHWEAPPNDADDLSGSSLKTLSDFCKGKNNNSEIGKFFSILRPLFLLKAFWNSGNLESSQSAKFEVCQIV
jgi:hypothetical protein